MPSMISSPGVIRSGPPGGGFVAVLPAIVLLLCASLTTALEAPSKPFLDKNNFYLSSAGFRVQLANDAAGKAAMNEGITIPTRWPASTKMASYSRKIGLATATAKNAQQVAALSPARQKEPQP